MRVLLVEDERSIAVTLSNDLKDAGHNVRVCDDGKAALAVFQESPADCVITDLRLPGMDGLSLLKAIRGSSPSTHVILITGHGSVPSAIEAIRHGAYDYIEKPFVNQRIVLLLEKVGVERELREENRMLRGALEKKFGFGNLVGKNAKMLAVYELVETISNRDCNVLIEGESGTGKELVAQAIHFNGPRRVKPLIKMSCAVFSETLIEDELFGHEKGAFTDARERKIGRFERAADGSLFMDDIDDVPPRVQVKLLRVLEEHEFERLGSAETISTDFRLIAATKQNLTALVAKGLFRDDLFHRLNVVTIKLPPLRERLDDIPLLVAHFIGVHGKGKTYHVEPSTFEALQRHSWPGNIRELENGVERAIALAGEASVLSHEHLCASVVAPVAPAAPHQVAGEPPSLREAVRRFEVEHIKHVLKLSGGSKAVAAKRLGLSRKSMWEKLRGEEPE
ncbi:MAG: sigma-54 dependent transcriptional regulator [Planctomycetota bacterium]|nr:sigma-54 dependent transcriptional regulator [Planctomycetota bacterium]